MRTSARRLVSVAILGMLLQPGTALGSSMRGDANADGVLSVLDVFYVINTLFSGGEPSLRACLADANNDRDLTASDPIFLLNHLFAAGPAPLQIAETCNSEDDDCDGVVDNGFRNPVSGLYDQDFSCGSCAVNCGSSGQCIVTGGTPGCVASCDVAGNFDLNGNAADGCEFTLDSTAIYVSTAAPAADDASCGLGPVGTGPGHYPCLTITQGIGRAIAESRSRVNVAEGTYQEAILLESGVSLYGGFDNSTWARDPQNNLTQVNGDNPAIQGTDVANLTIDGLTVQSSVATEPSQSSYGIALANAQQIQILNNTISSGSGAAGDSGTNGAAGAAGGPGGRGNPGCENGGFTCFSCSQPARGTAGASSAGRPGGAGGLPGLAGGGGGNGGVGQFLTPGGAGASCGGLPACNGQQGGHGSHGTNGNLGQGGASFGSFSGTTYLAASGTDGTSGNPGNGGGGGGGGGGGDDLCDSYGSSGGGGGGGGGGGDRGTGGSGGGGSFAIVLLDTTATVVGNQIITSPGGNGGAGGNGGSFGTGGFPGLGGLYGGPNDQDDGGDGAPGGQGGFGGLGGNGGGGGGGPSIGIVLLGTSTVSSSSNTFEIGTGGVGGPSGSSPGATGHSGSAIPQPPVQIDVSSTFNKDLIVNDSAAGPVDAANDSMDLSSNNNAFVTQAAAVSLGCVSPAGLPNNGFFAANADHPNVQLAYSNDDDGVNAHHGPTPVPAGLPFNVPEGNYTNIHLFFSAGVPANVTVSLTYTAGLNEEISITVPDWFDEAVAPAYTLFNGGDRVDATPPHFCRDSNTVAIFGFNITADETRLLQTITIRTGSAFLGFFGATGVTLPGPLSLTKSDSAEQNP